MNIARSMNCSVLRKCLTPLNQSPPRANVVGAGESWPAVGRVRSSEKGADINRSRRSGVNNNESQKIEVE